MKKRVLYGFAALGVASLLYVLCASLLNTKGQALYGSARGKIYEASVANSLIATNTPSAMTLQPNTPPDQLTPKRMIIRNADLILEVSDLNRSLEAMSQLAVNSGGYVVSSNVIQGDVLGGGGGSAQISIRVPSEGFQSVISQLKLLSIQVKQADIRGEDITQKYVDLESMLKNLQTAKNQLQKIMDGAKKTEDVLNVFRQLTDTQGQIDVIEGQIKYYKDSVALSLINIQLQIHPASRVDKIRSWELVQVAKQAYNALLNQLEHFSYGLITFFILYIPMILIWGIIFLILFYIGRRLYYWMNR